jgi:UDP-2-acetamido-2-deoxy-ribo-hexuluronate aminotransferase
VRIPFIDLKPLVRELQPAVLEDFARIVESCAFVEGDAVKQLEETLRADLGVSHAVACASGSHALILALEALGVRPGMKVALPDVTFWATYEAVVQVGGIPVLIDIDPDDLQMSFADFARAHDALRFEAAVLVHLYGWASGRLADFRRFAAERGILLVEDAAQAYGVRVDGEPVFAGAAAATLSFYPAKVIGGAMDGGAVTLRDRAHAETVRSLKNHGRTSHYRYDRVGWNSRMSGLQGAYLTRACAVSERILRSRREVAALYAELLQPHSARIRTYGPPPGVEGNGYLVVTAVDDPGKAAAALGAQGIGTARTYPEPIHLQPPARDALRFGDLAHSSALCARVLNLPLYYGIALDDCRAAARALAEAS